MRISLLLLCVMLVAVTGCRTVTGFVPSANISEYFATRSAGFLMRVDGDQVRSSYMLSLAIRHPFESDVYIEATFENPQNPREPIVVGNQLKAQQSLVDLESPEVEGIRKFGMYDVVIRLYDSADKNILLGKHRQKVSALHSEQSIQKLSRK